MSFRPFGALTPAEQEAAALAPRPRVHIEPILLHDAGDLTKPAIPAMHVQIGDAHALLTMNDVKDLGESFAAAFRKLAGAPGVTH